ncbi:MFS transporter [Hydrogenophaga defluvii]|uniref:MFS transporter n=1 Tax=Hydrogenophaga defluvii TaxID=249410 RepID=A0ABW2SHL6_9BURK
MLRLGSAQTLAWASSYYLPAMLAGAMAAELGMAATEVWLGFSLALGVSALLGPFSGRAIDHHGGRRVLSLVSLLFATGLLTLALAPTPAVLWVGWLVLGVAMGCGLYDAAFAALVRIQGGHARSAITGITLLAGFASTVGWPLTAWLAHTWGWREACATWAVLHLVLGLPLNASLPQARAAEPQRQMQSAAVQAASASAPTQPPRRVAWALAYVFAATWFISTAMAAHLPQLLMAHGASLSAAVATAALVGPAQVAGRLAEYGLMQRFHPVWSARVAALAHPLGAASWLALGPVASPALVVLHGVGNGILTIAKGTLPLALFGPQGYGQRQGWIMAPSRLAQALAPLLFGACVARWGTDAMWVSTALGLSALGVLAWLKADPAR